MSKLLYLITTTAGGAIGWWIGNQIGEMSGYMLSLFGSVLGVYFGRLIIRNYLD